MMLGVPTEGAVMGWHQELPLSTDGGTLQVTWFAGYADVIRWVKRNPLIVFPAKSFRVKLRTLVLLETQTGVWTGLVWT